MKIVLVTLLIVLGVSGFGCEMHGAKNDNHSEPNVSTGGHDLLQPRAENPNPPSYFPTAESR